MTPEPSWGDDQVEPQRLVAAHRYRALAGGHERQIALDDLGMSPGTLAP